MRAIELIPTQPHLQMFVSVDEAMLIKVLTLPVMCGGTVKCKMQQNRFIEMLFSAWCLAAP